MAVNQPLTNPDKSPGETSWELEVTTNINTTEQRLNALLRAIRESNTLEELRERVRRLQ